MASPSESGVADEEAPRGDVAEIIGRHLGLPAVSIPAEQAAAHFGWLSFAAATDNPASSALTRELLGWWPDHPGLLADLDEGHYFTP
ncbi:nucleoside-diphosphate sugar epimerase [Nonomuraea zeae]|uniref:Nucleoside-diphosphate sugar epimerase n=1 Tax=Nonomuraea zeae TaxID=1642303 RepID=A0A5S4GLS1_9ACTN|nr:nucleoside-diphosphate sugar epimerase [Nonomuraea zeae]